MHLDSLTIKNFRILEDIHVEKLGYVNLIVGKNNSGKSTVLEALALLASGFESQVIRRVIQNRKLLDVNLEEDKVINSVDIDSLFSKSIAEEFEIRIYIGDDIEFIVLEKGNDFKYIGLISGIEPEYKYRRSLKRDYSILSNSKLERSLHFFNYEYIDTQPVNNNIIAKEWDDISLTEAEDTALEMLRLIEPNILDLAFLNQDNQRVPYVRLANSKKRVPLHQMGDGIFRLLQIILKVLKAKDGFLLIDEFENGLHYSVQPDVWRLVFKLAKEFNIQVFATTHSWDCIESFAEVAKESELDGVLFRLGRSVRKSDEGKLIATVFDEEKLYHLTKSNIEVR